MARQALEDDPRFIEAKAALAPLKTKVANTKVLAENMVRNAKAEVEYETLVIVRRALDAGLSRNAIGRLLGKTSNADQIAVVEKAMQVSGGFMPLAAAKPADMEPEAPAMIAPAGWQFGPVVGEPGPGAEVTITNDAGDVYVMRMSEEELRKYYHGDGTPLTDTEVDDLLGWRVDYYVSWLLYPDYVEVIEL